LRYSWFHHGEAGSGDGRGLAAVNIVDAESCKVAITATATCRPMWIQTGAAQPPALGVAHIILDRA
jgi:hypothetical protein